MSEPQIPEPDSPLEPVEKVVSFAASTPSSDVAKFISKSSELLVISLPLKRILNGLIGTGL